MVWFWEYFQQEAWASGKKTIILFPGKYFLSDQHGNRQPISFNQ